MQTHRRGCTQISCTQTLQETFEALMSGIMQAAVLKFRFPSIPISDSSPPSLPPSFLFQIPFLLPSPLSSSASSSVQQRQFSFNCFLSHLIPPRRETECDGGRDKKRDAVFKHLKNQTCPLLSFLSFPFLESLSFSNIILSYPKVCEWSSQMTKTYVHIFYLDGALFRA